MAPDYDNPGNDISGGWPRRDVDSRRQRDGYEGSRGFPVINRYAVNKGETPSCGLSRATAISAPRVAAAVRLGLVTASQTAERERSHWGRAGGSCSLAWLGGWYKGSRADSRGNLTPASPDAGSDSRGSGASADEHPLPPTRYLEHPGYCGITLVPRFPPGQTLFFLPPFLPLLLCLFLG